MALKAGKTLMELAQELQRIQEEKKDFIVPTGRMEMTPEAEISFKNGQTYSFNMSSHSDAQMADYTKIPKAYYDRLKSEDKGLLASNVNLWLGKKAEENQKEARLVRTLDGRVRGFLSSRYRIYSTDTIFSNARFLRS